MHTFASDNQEQRGRANASQLAQRATDARAPFQPVNSQRPTAIAQRALDESLNGSAKVQTQFRLQQSFNQSPRVAAQAKLAQAMSRQSRTEQAELAIQRQEAPEEEELAQRQASLEDEEPLQGEFAVAQKEELPEEEEPLQSKSEQAAQREAVEDEEPLQGKFEPVQREALEEEEPLQGKLEPIQREASLEDEEPLQSKAEPAQKKENQTGLPDDLKAGVENLSGIAVDDVKVHYNSAKPAQLQALAYTQGTDIHVAPGQEQHLAHEAWHVVQQKQGRVQPTVELKGVGVNTETALESEADRMGAQAKREPQVNRATPTNSAHGQAGGVQLFRHVAQREQTNAAQVAQFAGGVVQLEGPWDTIKDLCSKLWELIKKSHTTKTAPAVLNILNLMTAAIRYARDDSSVGAQIGTGILTLLTALDAAVTAVEEWNAATGEGKDLWKKRVDAIEKVTSALILAASLFALPFSPTLGAAIGTIGAASVKVLRGGYDWLAQNVFWGSSEQQQQPSNYNSI
jgi:hypothetical protein